MKKVLTFFLIIISLVTLSCEKFSGYYPSGTKVNATNITIITNATNATETTVQPTTPTNPTKVFGDNTSIYFLGTQGNAILILHKEHSALIDSGMETDAYNILKSLRKLGVGSLDYLILTHPSPWRIGGAAFLILRADPKKVIDNGLPMNHLSSYKTYSELTTTEHIGTDTVLEFGDVTLKLIIPYDDGMGFSPNMKLNSIVTKVTYGQVSILLTSDCNIGCEDRIMDADLTADVFEAADSASCDSNSLRFLKEIKPDAVIVKEEIACGETLDRFKNLYLNIYNLKNATTITTDGMWYSVIQTK